MSDISKIRIESGTYDIKDSQAREDIDLINQNLYVIHINSQTEDEIQTILADDKPKYVVLDNDITFTKTITLGRNLIFDINNHVINFNLPSFLEDPDLCHGFYNFDSTDVDVLKYNGNGNIHFKNGKIVGGNCSFIHGKNISFVSVDFSNSWNDHIFELCAMKDVLFDGCTFSGIPAGANQNAELVQIDPCTYGSFPHLPQESNTFDGTPCENITVMNCEFLPTSNANFQSTKGFGSHAYQENKFHKNIVVKNCIFNLSYVGVELQNVKKAIIDHCNFDMNNDSAESFKVRLRHTADDIVITNNVFNGSGFCIIKQDGKGNTAIISDNVFMNCNYSGSPMISYFGNDVMINNNIFTSYTQRGVILRPEDTSTVSYNVYQVSNNIFEPNDSAALTDNAIVPIDGIVTIENNTFNYRNLPSSQVIVVRSDDTSLNKAIVKSNFFNDVLRSNPSVCVYAFNARGYNDIYDVLFKVGDYNNTSYSDQSTNWDFTKFNTCVVVLGDGSHAQPHQFRQFNQNAKLDNRTFKFNGVDKTNNNATVCTFTINNSSFSYSSTGDTPIRAIYLKNE